jgi:hypothetical protein
MKIYISGPITNDKDAAIKFKKAENLLKSRGYDPVNPQLIPFPKFHQPDLGDEGVWEYFMHAAIQKMMECKHIYMLKGWTESRGANVEWDLAKKLGMVIHYEEEQNERSIL